MFRWYGPIAELGRCLAFLLFQNYITSEPLFNREYANNILVIRTLNFIFTLSALSWSIIILDKLIQSLTKTNKILIRLAKLCKIDLKKDELLKKNI